MGSGEGGSLVHRRRPPGFTAGVLPSRAGAVAARPPGRIAGEFRPVGTAVRDRVRRAAADADEDPSHRPAAGRRDRFRRRAVAQASMMTGMMRGLRR